jgi:hypothetical protein
LEVSQVHGAGFGGVDVVALDFDLVGEARIASVEGF